MKQVTKIFLPKTWF